MKPKRIIRLKEACNHLACRRTKFDEDYRYHTADDPYVPGTNVPRVKSIPLGPRTIGFLEHEIDALIDALAKAGGHSESKAKNQKAARELALRDAEPSPQPASKPPDAPHGPRSKPKRNAVKREQARTAHEDRDQAARGSA
jgi:predicted DNA-binding transcriptional regulator AlpA